MSNNEGWMRIRFNIIAILYAFAFGFSLSCTHAFAPVPPHSLELSLESWFKLAERMIARELRAITESPKIKNGVLNPNELGDIERELLDKFMEYRV